MSTSSKQPNAKKPRKLTAKQQRDADAAQKVLDDKAKADEDEIMSREPYTKLELEGFTDAEFLLLDARQLRDPYTLQQSKSRVEARNPPPARHVRGVIPFNSRLAPAASASAPAASASSASASGASASEVHLPEILAAADSPAEAIAMEAITEVRATMPNAGTITVDIAPVHEEGAPHEETPRSRSGSDVSARSASAVQVVSTRNGDIVNTSNGKLYNMFKPPGDLDPNEIYAEKPRVKRDKDDNTEERQPTSSPCAPPSPPSSKTSSPPTSAAGPSRSFCSSSFSTSPSRTSPGPPV
jgi:hypothetical protein